MDEIKEHETTHEAPASMNSSEVDEEEKADPVHEAPASMNSSKVELEEDEKQKLLIDTVRAVCMSFCELRPLNDKDIGVFAKKKIEQGMPLVFPISGVRGLPVIVVPLDDNLRSHLTNNIGPFAIEWINKCWKPTREGFITLPTHGLHAMSMTSFIRHSNKPNISFSEQGDIVANCEILANHEIFMNYHEINILESHIPTRKTLRSQKKKRG